MFVGLAVSAFLSLFIIFVIALGTALYLLLFGPRNSIFAYLGVVLTGVVMTGSGFGVIEAVFPPPTFQVFVWPAMFGLGAIYLGCMVLALGLTALLTLPPREDR